MHLIGDVPLKSCNIFTSAFVQKQIQNYKVENVTPEMKLKQTAREKMYHSVGVVGEYEKIHSDAYFTS